MSTLPPSHVMKVLIPKLNTRKEHPYQFKILLMFRVGLKTVFQLLRIAINFF